MTARVYPFIEDQDNDWMSQALCTGVDPELFFPEKGGDSAPAKAVCRACPVRHDCLEHALEWGERFGVWGGTSERERRNIRKWRRLNLRSTA